MRDWQAYVRTHLHVEGLAPTRETRIVRELAAQLEDFYREAVAGGAADADADAYARAQITDWSVLARDVRRADRTHRQPATDRLAGRIELRADPRRGGLLMFAHLLRDTRYAIRQLLRTPGFTVVAVLTLALGIGVTTAMFSVVNGVLLRPLPYPESSRLVRVHEMVPQYGRFSVAAANFFDWRAQNQSFERLVAYVGTSATFTGDDGPERVQGTAATFGLFELLGVAPLLGSTFTESDDKPGVPSAIVLSYGAWQQRYGGDPSVVGRSITMNGAPATIVGVMPQGFYFPTRTGEFWRPLALNQANASRGGHNLGVIARLKPGVALTQATAEMKGIAERLATQYPDNSAGESAELVLLQEQVVGAIRPALLTLFAAVGLVVLIACANVANLLLVRASVRGKEIAIRMALGAGRKRLVMQMLSESLVLAVAGGALGVLLGYLAIAPIQTLGASSLPRVADIALDWRVLMFAAIASIATGILFGLAPAWQASRAGVNAVLKEGGRSSTTSGSRWVRSGLLVVEVALSIVLLIGAVLLLRSFARLTSVDPGFQPASVLSFQVSLPAASYQDSAKRIAFFDRLVETLDGQPGVEAAGIVQTLPMRGGYTLSFDVRGRPLAKAGEGASANYRAISPAYFDTLGVPLRRGRPFSRQDTPTAQKVAIVDEAFARRHFPDADALGQGIDIGNGTDGFFEIVGVVGTVRHEGLDADAAPTMYVPFVQAPMSSMWVLAKGRGDPAALTGVARQVVREIDPALPAYSIAPLEGVVTDSVAARRFSMILLVLFAGVAAFLAAVGLYGVVAYSVSQRTREIGLRMAIGARPDHVLRMVVGGGMKLALVGVAIGLAGAVVLGRFVETMLFEVTPWDPVSYVSTSLALLAIAALACYVPARRAMRVDPIIAMHGE